MAQDQKFDWPLNGKLDTYHDPCLLGEGDFQTLTNMRYTDKGIRGVSGMLKINASAFTDPDIRMGVQFKKDVPPTSTLTSPESYVIAQTMNGAGNTSTVYVSGNTASPPAADTFSTLYTVYNNSNTINASKAPDGSMVMCDGTNNMIWTGSEGRCAGFLTSTAAITDSVTNAKDFTDQINNVLYDSNNIATIATTNQDILVGATLPLQGVKFYVLAGYVNTVTSDFTVKYWNGSAWTAVSSMADGSKDSGAPLGKTGSVTWSDTSSVAKLKYLEGKLLYWYWFHLSVAPTVTSIYYVTVNAKAQTIKDIWDGIPRSVAACFRNDGNDNVPAFVDYTLNVYKTDYYSGIASTYLPANHLTGWASSTSGQSILVGFSEKVRGLQIRIASDGLNTNASSTAIAYWSGSAWVNVGKISDGTSTGTATASTGTITVSGTPVANETFVVGTQTFTFKATRATAGQVAISADNTVQAHNIAEAINTDIPTQATADHVAGVVTVTAFDTGTFGDLIDLSETATGVAVSGAKLASGADGKTLATSGVITWEPPSGVTEFTKVVSNSEKWYYYKIYWSKTLDDDVYIDSIFGVPVQKVVNGYMFPLTFKNRLWLVSEQANKRNTAICASQFTNCVFNGSDSTEIEFGGKEDITSAATLFTRYGSSIYENMVVCKRNETWMLDGTTPQDFKRYLISNVDGCIAPQTMKTCDVAYEVSGGITKHVVVWLSASGVLMFDANSIIHIDGDIHDRFDTTSANYINESIVYKFGAFYDAKNSEYHLLIATGSSTVLNEEWVYDLKRKKWYLIDRGTTKRLNCGWNVEDSYGNRYTYGGTKDGYVEVLEHRQGTTKPITFDGTGIAQTFRTGDVPLSKSAEYETNLRDILLTGKAVTPTGTAPTVTVTHYGDGDTTGAAVISMNQTLSGKRIFRTKRSVSKNAVFHSIKCSVTTTAEEVGFEPLILSGIFEINRQTTGDSR